MNEVRTRETVKGARLVFGYLGIFLMMIGCIILTPLFMYIFYPEEAVSTWLGFFIPGVSTIAFGFILSLLIYNKEKGRLENHEDIILVILTWLFTIFFGCLPFLFLDDFNYDFTKAFFEATSGFSTTGYSMISNYSNIPNVYYFYRSINLFFGGVGLILILNSAVSDKYNMRLYTADGHSDKLLPNIVKSARLILSIYLGYSIIGVNLLYGIGQVGDIKMSYFEAFNYTMACISAGGFGMHAESIGYYNNVGVEVVCCILMVLAATNFLIHLNLIRGRLHNVYHHCETKIVLAYILIIAPICSVLATYLSGNSILATANKSDIWRIASFSVISAFTGTGLTNTSLLGATTTFATLGYPVMFILAMLMYFGGEAGSTSGGIKLIRIAYIGKGIFFSYVDSLSNKHKIKTHYIERFGKKEVFDYNIYYSALTFALLFLIVSTIGVFIFVCYGMTIGEAIFNVGGSISTVGLNVGYITPDAPKGILWTTIFLMFLGRIEVTPIMQAAAMLVNKVRRRGF
jgi:trk system potassium uptake protein TrkH